MEPININKPEWYCESSALPLDDQEWIWKNTPYTDKDKPKESVDVYENVDGTYKRGVNSELSWDKSEVISKLKLCTSNTPQIEIAGLLEEVFSLWPSKEGYWLSVAQIYTARVINRVVSDTAKQYSRGAIRKTPVHYFSYRIQFRTKRKELRSTNGTRK